jgi:glycosyltransferase 2 family protein
MTTWVRRFGWPIAKILLGLAILVGVSRQFARDLLNPDMTGINPKLAEVEIRWSWLTLSAGLYLLFFAFSAWYWQRLLKIFGDRPTFFRVCRAYYIGQFGKYVPGKAWALILRGRLVQGENVRFGTAVLTSFYEVLTTMAAGALLAAVIFIVQPPHVGELEWPPVLTGLLVLGMVGVPLLPGVFNVLMQQLPGRFQGIDTFKAPRLRGCTLAEGLLTIGVGWAILGLSVWAGLVAVLPDAPELTLATWAQITGAIGLSYVVGFLAIVVPSGIGVRDVVLLNLLGFAGKEEATMALAVVLIRLAWTGSELVAAAGLQLAAASLPRKNELPV